MKILFFTTLFLFSNFTSAMPIKMIYGDDDRIDFDLMSSRPQRFSSGVATMATKSTFTNEGSDVYTFAHEDLVKYRICLDEDYVEQSLLGNCTGFLVGKDLLVTAGHCFNTLDECRESQWIFDYDLKQSLSLSVSKDSVFSCKRVIKRVQSDESKLDFAIIQLDREVGAQRHIFKVARSSQISQSLSLGMLGHPTGLPIKYAGPFTPLDISEETTFSAKVDAFGGNSGSPVFERRSGMVYGMLIGGAMDYEEGRYQCKEAVKCEDDNTSEFCSLGETILRSSVMDTLSVLEYQDTHAELDPGNADDLLRDYFGWTLLHDAIFRGDLNQVKFLVEIGLDINAKANYDGYTPVLMAIELNEMDILSYLIKNFPDLNAQQSSSGETLLMKVINKEYIDLAFTLIDMGADLKVQAKDGFNSCDLANFIGSFELIKKCENALKE